MNNQDRAKRAVKAMTSRAVHTKKVAEYIIKHNHFTCHSVSVVTGIPHKSMNRIISNLEENYDFEFERDYYGRTIQYTLIDCNFFTKRKNKVEKVAPPPPIIEALKKPLFLNPLWALALQMQL